MICSACDFDPGACVETSYRIALYQPAQSLNDVGVNTKNNHAYRKARRSWKRELARSCSATQAKKKRRVFFTRLWGKGKRAYDFGNLVGGFKPLLDENFPNISTNVSDTRSAAPRNPPLPLFTLSPV